jgi:hypothetical protein
MKKQILAGALALTLSSGAYASPFTLLSPTTEGNVVAGITEVGGIVIDLVGTNGTRVMSQISAGSLFDGSTSGTSDVNIGEQSGWDTSITNALGGGIAQAAFRLSLFDGDNAAGEFDFNDNILKVNGLNFGNWSTVQAQNTDGLGNVLAPGFSGGGFRNGLLDTGWFFTTDATLLGSLITNLVATEIFDFNLGKLDSSFQVYDFSQGIDGSLINVGSGPVVTPPNAVPLPAAVWLFGSGLMGFIGLRRKNKLTTK